MRRTRAETPITMGWEGNKITEPDSVGENMVPAKLGCLRLTPVRFVYFPQSLRQRGTLGLMHPAFKGSESRAAGGLGTAV